MRSALFWTQVDRRVVSAHRHRNADGLRKRVAGEIDVRCLRRREREDVVAVLHVFKCKRPIAQSGCGLFGWAQEQGDARPIVSTRKRISRNVTEDSAIARRADWIQTDVDGP